MSTAQIIFEQYQILPKRVKKELFGMISKEHDDYVQVNLSSLITGLEELKLVREGKKKSTPARDFLLEMEQSDVL
jgi:hypothetical protein